MRLDQFVVEVPVDLIANITDVYVDDIGVAVEIDAPDIDREVGSGDDPVPIAHQVFQQLKFLGCKFDRSAGPGYLLFVEVHFEVGGFQDIAYGFGLSSSTLQKGPDLKQELAELERFDQVIVGAGVIAFDLVVEGTHGSEHDHKHVRIAIPNGLAEFVAIHAGQVDVENDEVEISRQQ